MAAYYQLQQLVRGILNVRNHIGNPLYVPDILPLTFNADNGPPGSLRRQKGLGFV